MPAYSLWALTILIVFGAQRIYLSHLALKKASIIFFAELPAKSYYPASRENRRSAMFAPGFYGVGEFLELDLFGGEVNDSSRLACSTSIAFESETRSPPPTSSESHSLPVAMPSSSID